MTRSGPDTGLDAHVVVRHPGGVTVDVPLTVPSGRTIALLGPNGAGKTTVLRALAGLRPLDDGHVRLSGQVLDDPAARAFRPPEHRGVGVVFQDYLLFPHLTALDNVAFGPRARGVGRRAAADLARHWLDRVGLSAHTHLKPRALSGGQAQRVALARALATTPDLLLLDEPLAALDASTRILVRSELRGHLADYPGACVLVTHDPLDAMVLADELLVVERGRVVQSGPPAEIARHPRTDYIAALVGLNLYQGAARGTAVTLTGGGAVTAAHPADGPVFVAFPPSAVSLHRGQPHGSPRNTWPLRVTGIEQHADTVRVRLNGQLDPPAGQGDTPAAGPGDLLADITTAALAELRLGPGDQVWAAVKATEVRTYPA